MPPTSRRGGIKEMAALKNTIVSSHLPHIAAGDKIYIPWSHYKILAD